MNFKMFLMYHAFNHHCISFTLTLQIETELNSICHDVLHVIDNNLIPNAATGESKVFYYKMYVFCFTNIVTYCLYMVMLF